MYNSSGFFGLQGIKKFINKNIILWKRYEQVDSILMTFQYFFVLLDYSTTHSYYDLYVRTFGEFDDGVKKKSFITR